MTATIEGYRDWNAENAARLNAPAPRFRFFQKSAGPMFCWTVEKVAGKYESLVYLPIGSGARSGKARAWRIAEARTCRHAKRSAAKGRALRLFEAWEAKR